MIILFHSRGSAQCELIRPAAPPEALAKLRVGAVGLLRARACDEAIKLLTDSNFELFEATNGFGDEFHALAKRAKTEAYVEFSPKSVDPKFRSVCRAMVSAYDDLGFNVRIVCVELDVDTSVAPVCTIQTTPPVEVVQRALRDAENLLANSGAVSAIDRAHTALHGYLKWVCAEAGNSPAAKDPSVTELLKHAEKHQEFAGSSVHSDKTVKVLRAFGSALDAINQVRNRGSIAHPNEQLVDEADAMLVVNAARSILRYFDDRLR